MTAAPTSTQPKTSPAKNPHNPCERPTVAFYTLGCKTNQLETSTLANTFTQNGWQVVPFDASAQVYVINSCTVTERSDNETHRIIRRARLSNQSARIVVTGCYAQVAPQQVAAQPGVTDVIGNHEKSELFELLKINPVGDTPHIQVSEIDKSRIMQGAAEGALDRVRGSLKIQDGCDYKCTYCIIWEARGKSRSLSVVDIKKSLQEMIAVGFKEIVLTGINIGQYDDPDTHLDLAGLLQELIQLDGNFRLRLTSLDPKEVTNKLIDVIAASNGKICPHIHLSAQSCDDVVLKRMGRRHHVDEMISVCEQLEQKVPSISIGSDIIVGFPGETDDYFENTRHVLETVPMNYFHVFSYSKRKETPAATFDEQIPERTKKARATILKTLSDTKDFAYRQGFLDRELEIITEHSGAKGMSAEYIRVTLINPPADLPPNTLGRVRVTAIDADTTWGEWLGTP